MEKKIPKQILKCAENLAQSYHDRVATLSKSVYAVLTYGTASWQSEDNERYSKKYHRQYGPAKNMNPAYYLTRLHGAWILHLVPVRGEQIIVRLPLKLKNLYFGKALLPGDLYGRQRKIAGLMLITRYNADHVARGLALENGAHKIEHGATIAIIRAEIRHKQAVAAKEKDEVLRGARLARATQLIIRLCHELVVTVDHARAAGYCWSGINAYREKFFSSDVDKIPAKLLRQTGDTRVEAPIKKAAQELAQKIIA